MLMDRILFWSAHMSRMRLAYLLPIFFWAVFVPPSIYADESAPFVLNTFYGYVHYSISPPFVLSTSTWPAGLAYRVEPNNSIAITGYSQALDMLVIPAFMGGRPVTTIASNAFAGTSLRIIVVPYTVTAIADRAFLNSISLARIYFEGSAPAISQNILSGSTAMVYYCTGTYGWANPWGGRPAALWNAAISSARGDFEIAAGGLRFRFAGPVNHLAVIEATTNLAGQSWTRVTTQTLFGGTSEFTDGNWTNARQQYYRVTVPVLP